MHIDIKTRHISRLARNTLALILADGRGARLQDLTPSAAVSTTAP
jgi:ADP-glucose pyrophosphorylase